MRITDGNSVLYRVRDESGTEYRVTQGYTPHYIVSDLLSVAEGLSIPVPTSFATLQAMSVYAEYLVTSGIYAKCDTISQFAYGNSSLWQFALLDWKQIGRQHTIFGARTYTPQGFQGNVIDCRIEIDLNLATEAVNYKRIDAGRLMNIYKQSNNFLDSNSANTFNRMQHGSTNLHRINSGSLLDSPAFSTAALTGPKSINRFGETDVRLYDSAGEYLRSQAAFTSVSNMGAKQSLFWSGVSVYSGYGASDYILSSALTYNEVKGLVAAKNIYLAAIGQPQLPGLP